MTIRLGSLIAPSWRGVKSESAEIGAPASRQPEAHDRSSEKNDFSHVDGDEERFLHKLVIAFVGVDSPLGRNNNTVHVTVFRGVVEPGSSPKDVNGVVVTAQQAIWAEARDLLPRVALYVVGKGHLQASPGFTLDLDRGDFLSVKSFVGVEERSIEIRPQRFTNEVTTSMSSSRPPCASTARLSKSFKLIVPFFLLLDRSVPAGSEQPFLAFRLTPTPPRIVEFRTSKRAGSYCDRRATYRQLKAKHQVPVRFALSAIATALRRSGNGLKPQFSPVLSVLSGLREVL
jgi:hypothetical protein